MTSEFKNTVASLGKSPKGTYENKAVFDGHLRIYLTLRCNLRCSYCVNEQMGRIDGSYSLKEPLDWARAINREQRHVVFTGGEPFLYPGLTDLINQIDPVLQVRLYTNLSLDLQKQLSAIRRPVRFYISWHPKARAARTVFLKNYKELIQNRLFAADLHAIDAPESRERLHDDLAFFRQQGINIILDSDQRSFEGGAIHLFEGCLQQKIYLIAPDGARYQCVSRLVRRTLPLENMLEEPLGREEVVSICPDYGNCAPCDALGETKMAWQIR